MFDYLAFYQEYSIDLTKLKRDYEKNPLKKVVSKNILGKVHKIWQLPEKEDLQYLYIVKNIPRKVLAEFFNIKEEVLQVFLARLSVKKPKELMLENSLNGLKKLHGVTKDGKLKISQETLEKRKQTCLKKYGGPGPACSKEVRQKMQETTLKNYGVKHALQNKKLKQKAEKTTLKRFNVKNASQADEIKQKKIETTLKHYGVENPFQAEVVKKKIEKTTLKRYGTKNPMQNKDVIAKGYKTKKINGTMNTSSEEEEIYILLQQKFKNIERQYRSEKYPFRCDFYIHEIDLYIEYQGNWTHGKEPYDASNKKHIEKLKEFQSKALKKDSPNQYESVIKVWTVRDPLKRETAKKNNLNWLEFFNMDQFLNWFSNI